MPGSAAAPREVVGLEFDGIDDYVEIDGFRYDGTYPITFEAVVEPRCTFGCLLSVFEQAGLGLHLSHGDWVFKVSDEPRFHRAASDAPAELGVRQHVAGVFDGASVQLFVNGTLQKKITGASSRLNPSGLPFLIASKTGPGGKKQEFFAGRVDSVRISKGARYTQNYAPPPSFEKDAETLVLLNFSRGEGDRVEDESGNGFYGRIHGAHWPRQGAPPSPDRIAAEWVLSRGGSCSVSVAGRVLSLSPNQSLPEEPFTLNRVYYSLKGKTFDLFRLADTRIRYLFLRDTTLSDADLVHIPRLVDLTFLGISNCPEVTNDGIAHVAWLPRLSHIYLSGTGVDGHVFSTFAVMKQLKNVVVYEKNVTDAVVERLIELPQLEAIGATHATGEFANTFRNANLRSITVGSGLTRSGLKAIASLPSLRELRVGYACPIQDDWLVEFAGHPALRNLVLTGSQIGDAAVVHLQAIPKLESVNVTGAQFTAAGLEELKKAKPGIQVQNGPPEALRSGGFF